MQNIWYKILLLLIMVTIILIFNQCGDGTNKYYNGTKLENIKYIKSKNIGLPTQILIIGNNLLLIDDKPLYGSGKIKIFNLKTNKEISIGFDGSGPGEFIQPTSLNKVIGSENAFTINDLSLFRVTKYSIKQNKIVMNNLYKLKGGMPIQTVLLNDGRIIALGFGLTYGRIAVYDTTGTIIDEIGQIPPHYSKNVPTPIVLQAYEGQLRVKPDGKIYVISAQYSDRIDIYTNKGKLVKTIIGPINYVPQYSISKVGKFPVMTLDEENTIYGYIDIFAGNKFIYALFSGRKFKEHKFQGHFVHVYDYAGRFIKTYVLKEDISSFSVDEVNNCIYGVQHYPQIRVLKFKLNNKL